MRVFPGFRRLERYGALPFDTLGYGFSRESSLPFHVGGHVLILAYDPGDAGSVFESFNQVVISQGRVLPTHTEVQENRRSLGAVSSLKMPRSLLS